MLYTTGEVDKAVREESSLSSPFSTKGPSRAFETERASKPLLCPFPLTVSFLPSSLSIVKRCIAHLTHKRFGSLSPLPSSTARSVPFPSFFLLWSRSLTRCISLLSKTEQCTEHLVCLHSSHRKTHIKQNRIRCSGESLSLRLQWGSLKLVRTVVSGASQLHHTSSLPLLPLLTPQRCPR